MHAGLKVTSLSLLSRAPRDFLVPWRGASHREIRDSMTRGTTRCLLNLPPISHEAVDRPAEFPSVTFLDRRTLSGAECCVPDGNTDGAASDKGRKMHRRSIEDIAPSSCFVRVDVVRVYYVRVCLCVASIVETNDFTCPIMDVVAALCVLFRCI